MNRRQMIAGTLAAGALAGLPGGTVANETLDRLSALGFTDAAPSGHIDWNSPTGFLSESLTWSQSRGMLVTPSGLGVKLHDDGSFAVVLSDVPLGMNHIQVSLREVIQ